MGRLNVALLTKEFPPEVYGGAGVHVEYLARALGRLADIDVAVHCFGAPRTDPLVAGTYEPAGAGGGPALDALSVDVAMAAAVGGADLVHSHTWYANIAGHLGKLLHGMPHVVTAHSLEPLRPWKAEQLGGGYEVSKWCERTGLQGADAVIAVSGGMRDDLLSVYPALAPERVHVVHNGIDVDEYQPTHRPDVGDLLGLEPAVPYVMFVGRITRQKGVALLLEAARSFYRDCQLLLCAAAPDTPELAAETRGAIEAVRSEGVAVEWVEGMLPRADVIALLTGAAVFVCPSLYEPFGLINLEAMACETPVVATNVGGIPEVVVDGVTGYLVEPDAAALAERVNELLGDANLARRMGRAGRQRVTEHFAWPAIAEQTAAIYRSVLG